MSYSIGALTFLSRGYSREESRFPRKQVLKHIFKLTGGAIQGGQNGGGREMVEAEESE